MLSQLVLVSAASFMSWQLFKTIMFFQVPGRLAPFVVLLFSFLWSLPFDHTALLTFASSAGVALIIKLIGVEGPEPWKIPSVRRPERIRKPRTYPPGAPANIPRTKRTDIGSRIPDLP